MSTLNTSEQTMNPVRWETREVKVGQLVIGGHHPVRIQSMTNTPTADTEKTLKQCISLVESGCELIRITTPSISEAKNLETIRQKLQSLGYSVPLIADVHFNRKVAEFAAGIVEKVRINPGNFVDVRQGKKTLKEREYEIELEKIAENIYPLLEICKRNGTVLRIGTNHGSLSERILHRYGDTAEGMANSAMEFLRICRDQNFHDIVVSMKSSQTKMMVYATRLLVEKMMSESMNYPVHLGVTEAGDAEDGRIKSAAGIGSLLMQGIGDTIRVSLTESPENEIPVANKLRSYCCSSQPSYFKSFSEPLCTSYQKRETTEILDFGNGHKPRVIADAQLIGEHPQKPDYFLIQEEKNRFEIQKRGEEGEAVFPLKGIHVLNQDEIRAITPQPHLLSLPLHLLLQSAPDLYHKLAKLKKTVLLIDIGKGITAAQVHEIQRDFQSYRIKLPVILKNRFDDIAEADQIIEAAVNLSLPLIDGFGDGIWLSSSLSPEKNVAMAFNILQANQVRISKTEFISCPGCGRTKYDLSSVLQQIKAGTSHLKGIKIGVMGCIVNGPGEMADADFGVVGSQPFKVDLYCKKQVVKKGIPQEEALEELLRLITASQANPIEESFDEN